MKVVWLWLVSLVVVVVIYFLILGVWYVVSGVLVGLVVVWLLVEDVV